MEHIQIGKLVAQRYKNKSNFGIYKEHLEDLRRQNDLVKNSLTLLGAGAALSLGVTATIAISNRRLKVEILKRTQAEEKIHQLNLNLEQLAMTDELTQLANRRAFFNRADEELRRSSRYKHPLSFMMIDIDHFKNINDTYGHDAGDEALSSVAKMLTNNIRDIDFLARFGGEEFVVMMPETNLTSAVELAERLRLSVESTPCLIKEIETRFTVSIGVASMHEDIQDINLLIKDADTAMYKAKEQGRNRVVYFES